ncbi:MAG: hypothetical protein FWE33_04580 [Defluviitaleaceae bacterium]|nr:hypothetical protein [Defluviitaleaceae bacterium]
MCKFEKAYENAKHIAVRSTKEGWNYRYIIELSNKAADKHGINHIDFLADVLSEYDNLR